MRTVLASIALRIGLAAVFLSAAISGFISPQNWIGYFPPFARGILSTSMLIIIFGIYELCLALLIVFKRNVTWPAMLAALTLLGITLFNLNLYDVVFRDLGLALAALALFFIGKVRS